MAAGPGEIMLAFPHNGWVRAEFMNSVIRLQSSPEHDLVAQAQSNSAGSVVSYARNSLVTDFLESPCQWLLMIDTDMTFSPAQVGAIAEAAEPVKRPVVSGACAILTRGRTATAPSAFYAVRRDGEITGFDSLRHLPADGLVQVDAVGAAFLMVHRGVLEKIPFGTWFCEGFTPDGGIRGEDLSFCVRVAEAGFPIYVHAGIRPGHMKTVCLVPD